MELDQLRVGGVVVPRSDALALARRYLTERAGWSYPSYDGYQQATALGALVDGDFLAPALLNVPRISVRAYEGLQRVRPDLQTVLDAVPPKLRLEHASDEDLDHLGQLFSVLDGAGVHGVSATILAKILHRKRPAFIPLYDDQVRGVYQDGPGAPVPTVRGRSWREFMPLFAAAVREDLVREMPFWQEIAGLAAEPPITPLRALDIVAWWAGRPGRSASPPEDQ